MTTATNGHDVQNPPGGATLRNAPGTTPDDLESSEFADVRTLAAERRRLRQLNAVDNNGEILDEKERKADRKVDRTIRQRQRRGRRRLGLADVTADSHHRLTEHKLNRVDQNEKLWLRRALRRQRQLTDPAAKLAQTYRQQRLVSGFLALLTFAGIAWTSQNVAHGLGGANPELRWYLIEPVISAPLLVLVFMQVVAVLAGRGSMLANWKVYGVEIASLVASTTLSVSTAFKAPEFDPTFFIACLIAPALIVGGVVLQLVAAELFGSIIRETVLDEGGDNMRERVKRATAMTEEVREHVADGSLPVQEDGLPSVKAIQKRMTCDKLIAQCVRDQLVMFREQHAPGVTA